MQQRKSLKSWGQTEKMSLISRIRTMLKQYSLLILKCFIKESRGCYYGSPLVWGRGLEPHLKSTLAFHLMKWHTCYLSTTITWVVLPLSLEPHMLASSSPPMCDRNSDEVAIPHLHTRLCWSPAFERWVERHIILSPSLPIVSALKVSGNCWWALLFICWRIRAFQNNSEW